MRPSYEDLEEQVAYLRSELSLQTDAGKLATIGNAFGLTDQKARVVLVLYKAKGRVVSGPHFMEVLPPRYGRWERSDKLIQTIISHLRKKLGWDAVETLYDNGYRLSDQFRARVAIVLGEAVAPLSDVQALHEQPSEALRDQAAHIAGILAHRDEDGGLQIATIYRRIADRLTGQPRVAA